MRTGNPLNQLKGANIMTFYIQKKTLHLIGPQSTEILIWTQPKIFYQILAQTMTPDSDRSDDSKPIRRRYFLECLRRRRFARVQNFGGVIMKTQSDFH